MPDPHRALAKLRRPRILIRAARLAEADYRRERDLKRLLGGVIPSAISATLEALITREAELETERRTDALGYSIARHVDLLTALMVEARLARDEDQTKASGSSALRLATKSSSASRMPGSSGGASYSPSILVTRAPAIDDVSRAPSSSQVSKGL